MQDLMALSLLTGTHCNICRTPGTCPHSLALLQ